MELRVTSSDGLARTGELKSRRGLLQTPSLLIYSRNGALVNTDNSTLEHLATHGLLGVSVSIPQMAAGRTPAAVIQRVGGVHNFINAPNNFILGTTRDTTVFEFDNRPLRKQNVSDAIYFNAHEGAAFVDLEAYMRTVQAMKPDAYVMLTDEMYAHSSKRRTEGCVARTNKWALAGLNMHEQMRLSESSDVLAAVVGGADLARRLESCRAAARLSARVAGYVVAGLGTGESPGERAAILQLSAETLPPTKPRFTAGLGGPDEILQAIAHGMDVLESRYTTDVTAAGQALVFGWGDPKASGAAERGLTKISIASPEYKHDHGPLLPGCTCYCCRHHTKGYLHHLLDAHEMLGWTLLEYHNLHHMQRFMKAVREAIARKRFAAFQAEFLGFNDAADHHPLTLSAFT